MQEIQFCSLQDKNRLTIFVSILKCWNAKIVILRYLHCIIYFPAATFVAKCLCFFACKSRFISSFFFIFFLYFLKVAQNVVLLSCVLKYSTLGIYFAVIFTLLMLHFFDSFFVKINTFIHCLDLDLETMKIIIDMSKMNFQLILKLT